MTLPDCCIIIQIMIRGCKEANSVLKQYLGDNILITDGAMGTYYSHLTGVHTTLSELANIENPQIIKEIHQQYIDAGARLIRTNTFSTNSYTLKRTREAVSYTHLTTWVSSPDSESTISSSIWLSPSAIPWLISTKHRGGNITHHQFAPLPSPMVIRRRCV